MVDVFGIVVIVGGHSLARAKCCGTVTRNNNTTITKLVHFECCLQRTFKGVFKVLTNTYPGKVGVYKIVANRTRRLIVWSQSKSQMTDLWYVCVPFYFRLISALGTNPSAL